MAARAYRGSGTAEVYPTDRHLSGAVNQVQAQMESVPRDLKENSQLGSIGPPWPPATPAELDQAIGPLALQVDLSCPREGVPRDGEA